MFCQCGPTALTGNHQSYTFNHDFCLPLDRHNSVRAREEESQLQAGHCLHGGSGNSGHDILFVNSSFAA